MRLVPSSKKVEKRLCNMRVEKKDHVLKCIKDVGYSGSAL